MPIVIVSKKKDIPLSDKNLRTICDEVVTFALNTSQAPLQPGNTIISIDNGMDARDGIDILIRVECCYTEDRFVKRDESSELIRNLVRKAYRGIKTGPSDPKDPDEIEVAVWVVYLNAAYAGPENLNKPNVKMSKSSSMFKRIKIRCGFSPN